MSPTAEGSATEKSEDEKPEIIVQIKGLSCPFCAYGLEKKLKKMSGVKSVTVSLDKAHAKIELKAGHQPPSKKSIKKAVKNAGFKLSDFKRYPSTGPEAG